jgi:hypothetical protein
MGTEMKKTTRYPRPRRQEIPAAWGRGHRSDVPADAVDLSDDILRLELVVSLLRQVNPLHTGDTLTQRQRDGCDLRLRTTTTVIRNMHRYAKDRLAREYLAP